MFAYCSLHLRSMNFCTSQGALTVNLHLLVCCHHILYSIYCFNYSSPSASTGLANVVCCTGELPTWSVDYPPDVQTTDWPEGRWMHQNTCIVIIEMFTVLQLVAPPPFTKPPRFLRAKLYHYHFTKYNFIESL